MKQQNTKISLHQQKSYWHKNLGGFLPSLELPINYPRTTLMQTNIGLSKSWIKITKEIEINKNIYE
ncbi:MAG: hypothetical protein QNJ68_20955 [Microcoleaceae cyanobacterium MO_207.B10]|nr:hypothetical protein [Microcoleaceae cyanobacterium MO_207.B10]